MKKRFIVLMCAIFILGGGALYFFKFTYYGQEVLYDVFGGTNLHLVSDIKELYWFDVHHRNDPTAPIFGRIEKTLIEFNPDLILVEGGADTFEGSRGEAIYAGESSFATYLANKNGMMVEDIEPSFSRQIEYLQSKYKADDILAMYLIRQICSERMLDNNSGWDFDTELLHLTQFLINNGLDYKSKTLECVLNTVNTVLPGNMDNTNWRDVDFRALNDVYANKSGVLYPIYNDITNYRNIYLIELLKEKKNTYNRIYIVMGGGHLDDTKEQLEQLYSD